MGKEATYSQPTLSMNAQKWSWPIQVAIFKDP